MPIYVHTLVVFEFMCVCVCMSLCLCRHACTFGQTWNLCAGAAPLKGTWGLHLHKRTFYICLQKIFIDQRMKRVSRFCSVLICQFGSHKKCTFTNLNLDTNIHFALDLICFTKRWGSTSRSTREVLQLGLGAVLTLIKALALVFKYFWCSLFP